jgi:hypothetical protein
LRRTHRQLETGQYAQAYPTLKRLADGAAQRGMPVQAATLYVQAARARIEMAAPGAQNAAWDAVALGQRALHLLSGAGRTARAQALLARMLKALERRSYYEQAVTLRAEGAALLGAQSQEPVSSPQASSQAALPAKCPSCNAPLRSDEVEWIEARHAALSAECAYCGSVVRAE